MIIKNKTLGIYLLNFLILLASNVSICQETAPDSTKIPLIETIPTVDGEIVKTRLAALQSNVPLKYNEYVHAFVDFFTYRKPSFTKTMLERKNYFFPIFEEQLKKYNIPDEIKYLSLIESGLNPKAISYAGAAGLWQFMPKTGRIDFGLRIDKYVDERLHVLKSTEAACKYMRQLYKIFGDWELVLAAYNTGPGNVRRAIRKAGGGGFWEIYPYLHKQTRSYVPQYVAMIYMMHHASDYNILPDRDEVIPQSAPIMISNYINLNTLASLSHIPFDDLKLVNPHIISNELPENTKDFVLEIPSNCYSFFDENRQAILDSASKRIQIKKFDENNLELDSIALVQNDKKGKKLSKIRVEEADSKGVAIASNGNEIEEEANSKPLIKYHKVRRGENLSQIASKYHVDVFDIKAWNRIRKSNNIKYGQKLKIMVSKSYTKNELLTKKSRKKAEIQVEDEIVSSIENNEKGVLEKLKDVKSNSKTHIVKKGENLYAIANKYNLSLDELLAWNGIDKSGSINYGQKLLLYNSQKTIATKSTDENKEIKLTPKYHVVNKGDTIWSIAQRYEGITVEKIRKLNDIKSNNLKPGQKLRLS